MPSESEAKFAIEEIRAIQKYLNERATYLEQLFNAPAKEGEDQIGNFEKLFWRPTQSGNGEIVNESQVPYWVAEYPDITTRDGVKVGGIIYKLFDSGVLWRKKV